MSHSQDSATHDIIQLSTDSYCPTLAKETLVSHSPKINSRLSEKASSHRREHLLHKLDGLDSMSNKSVLDETQTDIGQELPKL
jgi:hypothetical protein